jgi:hypothetical protein
MANHRIKQRTIEMNTIPILGHPASRTRWALIALTMVGLSIPAADKQDKKPRARSESASPRVSIPVVAHWRFQDGMRNRVASPSHLIRDSSGNDRHGCAHGNPTYRSVRLPNSNLALVFDGRDDRVFIPDDESFHLTKSFTLEAYIQVDLYPANPAMLSQIVFRGDNRAGFDPWYLAIGVSGQLVFLVSDALNTASVVSSPQPIPTGELLHVAATMDDETGTQSLFINGERVAAKKTKVRAFGPLGGANPGVSIGNLQTRGDQFFRGTIDEVRISSVAIGPQQFLAPPSRKARRKR